MLSEKTAWAWFGANALNAMLKPTQNSMIGAPEMPTQIAAMWAARVADEMLEHFKQRFTKKGDRNDD